MFGIKLRSWMEAVRPKKKQNRKEKQNKSNVFTSGSKINIKDKFDNISPRTDVKDARRVLTGSDAQKDQHHFQSEATVSNTGHSRYSANNLSSPESAYSTGYSTDGTSPGAPPDYLINSYKHEERCQKLGLILNSIQIANSTGNGKNLNGTGASKLAPLLAPQLGQSHISEPKTPILKNHTMGDSKGVLTQSGEVFSGAGSPSLGITSPRQRNRIRTNPWVPGSVPTPSPVKHCLKETSMLKSTNKESPRPQRFLSPVVARRRSLSSSSCSSLSGASLHLVAPRPSISDEEDCTLNEMMGKYDESYVYEKETDILSDSDPTDCETDIDTGQDGGDEDDLYEADLDFIDNGSYLECEPRPDRNTGHCSYYNYDVQRKRSAKRRTTRRGNKQSCEKKRRSSSSKKRQQKQIETEVIFTRLDGSRSAGTTPLSVRRAGHSPISKLALDESLRKRSNSVSFYRDQRSNSVNLYWDHSSSIDRRDKEADLKYKELIFEADKILRTMKMNNLSPRRLLGPTNKRVELLRNTECSKPDVFVKNRPEESVTFSKMPSNSYNSPRFSPKKSHITNFIINNSPVLMKKELEIQNHGLQSPLCSRKRNEENHLPQKGILQKEKRPDSTRVSPKHKRRLTRRIIDSSSDSEDGVQRSARNSVIGCPQSEPVRRKVYFACPDMRKPQGHGKTNAFKLSGIKDNVQSTENLRQQVLLNTIVNLKRNLENQSASLKQVYSSSQNALYV